MKKNSGKLTFVESENFSVSVSDVLRHAGARSNILYPTYVLVPDRFTLQAEKILTGYNAVLLNTRVITFSMLYNIVQSELLKGVHDPSPPLDKNRGVLFMWRAIRAVADDFVYYRRVAKHYTFAEKMFNTINQLTSSMVDISKLPEGATGALTVKKMTDIATIYARYRQITKDYTDASGMLGYLIDNIKQSGEIKKANFFVCGFDHLSIQRAAVLGEIIKFAKSVTIGTRTGAELYEQLSNVVMGGGLYATHERADSCIAQSGRRLHVSKYKNVAAEAAGIANHVRGLLNMGVAPRDIVVLLCDYKGGYRTYEQIFNQNNISINMDVGGSLFETPLLRFISDVMTLGAHDTTEHLLAVVENALLGIEREDIFKIQNFCIKTNFNLRRLWHLGDDALEISAHARRIISAVYEIVKKFAIAKNIKEFCDVVISIVISAEELSKGFDTFYELCKTKLLSVLDAMAENSVDITISDFANMIYAITNAVTVSDIPRYLDRVMLGNLSEHSPNLTKYVFVAGASEGMLPVLQSDTDILTQVDISAVTQVIEPTATTQNIRAMKHAINVIESHTEKIFISHNSASGDGKQSGIVTKMIKRSSGKDGKSNVTMVDDGLGTYEVKDIHSPWFAKRLALEMLGTGRALYENQKYSTIIESLGMDDFHLPNLGADFANIDSGQELFLGKGGISVTAIEDFYKSPYIYFLTRGLGLRTRERYRVGANIIGSLIHELVREFTEDIIAKKSRSACDVVSVVLAMDEYAYFASDEINRPIIDSLYKESEYIIGKIKSNISAGDYRPILAEENLSFELCNESNANGDSIRIIGQVDRVDEHNGYALVIDYKTGANADISPRDVYMGTKLQLPLYLHALSAMEEYKLKSGGAVYFPLKSGYAKDAKMRGIVLGTDDSARWLDNELIHEGHRSKIYPLRNSKGEIKDGLCEYEMATVIRYGVEMARRAIDGMREGVITRSSPDEKIYEYYPRIVRGGGEITKRGNNVGAMKYSDFLDIKI